MKLSNIDIQDARKLKKWLSSNIQRIRQSNELSRDELNRIIKGLPLDQDMDELIDGIQREIVNDLRRVAKSSSDQDIVSRSLSILAGKDSVVDSLLKGKNTNLDRIESGDDIVQDYENELRDIYNEIDAWEADEVDGQVVSDQIERAGDQRNSATQLLSDNLLSDIGEIIAETQDAEKRKQSILEAMETTWKVVDAVRDVQQPKMKLRN